MSGAARIPSPLAAVMTARAANANDLAARPLAVDLEDPVAYHQPELHATAQQRVIDTDRPATWRPNWGSRRTRSPAAFAFCVTLA